MTLRSDEILQRLSGYLPVSIDLSLRDSYRQLLEKLGNPHMELPPVIHLAGTNGKGSTIAFMRAMLEAAGLKVHVYTSPHLVSFHERIRLAGQLISEASLCSILLECEYMNAKGPVSFFEITTAAAFLAFSRIPADVLLLEVGLGGRLDATNVIAAPVATTVTRISHDHPEFLGHTPREIAGEKAGIFKKNCPAIIGPQASNEARDTLVQKAHDVGALAHMHGRDWFYDVRDDGFDVRANNQHMHLPTPNLVGRHQFANAATAVATLLIQRAFKLAPEALRSGVQHAEWPGRLQRLKSGPLVDLLPTGMELWLDGGHNDSAGEVLAAQANTWHAADAKPLVVVVGMMNTKNPDEFLGPLVSHIAAFGGIPIPGESKCHSADNMAEAARTLGIAHARPYADVDAAIRSLIAAQPASARILITGSLYLAGHILKEHR